MGSTISRVLVFEHGKWWLAVHMIWSQSKWWDTPKERNN